MDGYALFRADRGSRGGGLVTYVSTNLTGELLIPTVEPVNFESLIVKIIFHDNKHIIITNIYKPPSASSDSINTINSLRKNSEMVVLGDFNCNWLHRSSSSDRNMIAGANFTQLIKEPTRIGRCSSSLLDWILVTNPDRISTSGILSDSFSDHSIVFCVWKIKIPKLPPKYIKVRQCKNINTEQFINDLANINWTRFYLIPSVENAWDFFYSEVNNVINQHAPFKTIRVKGRHLPWISPDLICLFKKRDRAWEKCKQSRDPTDREVYRQLRNHCKTQTRNARSNYYKDAFSQNWNNPKQFWKHLDHLLNKSNNDSINSVIVNDNVISDPLMIAQAFNAHFSQISSSLYSDYLVSSSSSNQTDGSFSFSRIQPSEVFQAISELKNGSVGPDGLEAKFLKLGSSILIHPLSDLYSMSLDMSSIPIVWKTARVTPIFKGGDNTDLCNYRPISIICTVTKIFEKIIYQQLYKYLNQSNILSPYQSGFRSGYSTTTALLKFTNDVFSSCDKNQCTGVIFLDLSKAFDLVDHYLLLDKLKSIGFNRNALLWFNAYLHNRRQFVQFKDAQSDECIMEKGVPQGSILGPLLFSIFVNDLPQVCNNCQVHLYADDTVVYFSSSNSFLLQNKLQTDLKSVQNWLKSNLLKLNMKKSLCMLFGTHHSLKSAELNLYFDNGTSVTKETSVKYLGIWLDPELNFKPHIDYIIKRTYSCLMPLYRSSNCFTFRVRKKIITQLILPIIDYADIVYQNTYNVYLKPLDVLFNNLCRFILKCPYRTHHCQLYNQLNWLLPDKRRQYHWFQFIFRCIYLNLPPYLKSFFCTIYSNLFSSTFSMSDFYCPCYVQSSRSEVLLL